MITVKRSEWGERKERPSATSTFCPFYYSVQNYLGEILVSQITSRGERIK